MGGGWRGGVRGLFHRCGFADCDLAWILGMQRAVVLRGPCNIGERWMGGFFQNACVSQDLALEKLGREVVIFVRGILLCM